MPVPPRLHALARLLILAGLLLPAAAPAGPRALALDLAGEGRHPHAALEFRRLALEADGTARSAYFWAAAQQYFAAGDTERALKMLDYAEDAGDDLLDEVTLLRMQAAWQAGDLPAAGFHARSLARSASAPLAALAGLTGARLAVLQGDTEAALHALPALPQTPSMEKAIRDYAAGRDKSPRLGGFLGLVPGLGYAYAGEYANALRSLLLNAIFLYGMAETAERDQWAAFTVITFFEITWYTGSIYGGMDASHRHNRRRLQSCLGVIGAPAAVSPDLGALPAISLRYAF